MSPWNKNLKQNLLLLPNQPQRSSMMQKWASKAGLFTKTITWMKCQLTLLVWTRSSVSPLHHLKSSFPTLWMAMISLLWCWLHQIKRASMPKPLVVLSYSTKTQLPSSPRLAPTYPESFYNTYLPSTSAEEKAWWTLLLSVFGNLPIVTQFESIFIIWKTLQAANSKLIHNSKPYSRPRNSNGRPSKTTWMQELDQKYWSCKTSTSRTKW